MASQGVYRVGSGIGEFRVSAEIPRTLLSPADDMQWLGMARFPSGGSSTPGGPGTTSLTPAPIAIRRVGGQRRILMVLYADSNSTYANLFGDVVEYSVPEGISLYSGATPSDAPVLVETRRWGGWHLVNDYPQWQDLSSGTRIGAIYWDEPNQRLWYSAYGYYLGRNSPFMGSVVLLDSNDTVRGGNYRQIGARHGPWYYRDNTVNGSQMYWKAVCNWIIDIPEYARAAMGGREIGIGGTVGSVGTQGHWGPGLHAIPGLPDVSDPPNTIIPLGMRIADFTEDGGPDPVRQCRRDGDYDCVLPDTPPPGFSPSYSYTKTNTGFIDPVAGVGAWVASQDQVNSFAWVDTGEKHGVVMFGRRATGKVWYGHNPIGPPPATPDMFTPYTDDGGTYQDSTIPAGYGNSHYNTGWKAAIRVYDPAHFMQVGRGERSPYSDGMRPVEPVLDWSVLWPNIPPSREFPDSFGTPPPGRWIYQYIANSAAWDGAAGELIWCQPWSEGVRPTMNIFTIT